MKKLKLEKLETIKGGNKDIDAFLDGVTCGYGLATIASGFGLIIAAYSCGFFE